MNVNPTALKQIELVKPSVYPHQISVKMLLERKRLQHHNTFDEETGVV